MAAFALRTSLARLSTTTCSRALATAATTIAPRNLTTARFASTATVARPRDDDLLDIREKPVSISYFTGNYKYNDLLIELDALYKKYEHWEGEAPVLAGDSAAENGTEEEHVSTVAEHWKLREKMEQMLAIPLKTSQWRKIVLHLNRLASLPKPLPEPVEQALQPYRRYDAAEQDRAANVKSLDALGRAYAVGRRKESSARCWVVEGDGQVLVNGVSLHEYFQRPVDRAEVTLPLEVTENMQNYNVWALVNGGGSTGQAQAIKLGVGRALLTHNHELKPTLRKAGCITRDPRVVERKKEGQRKARARYTWVKR
ncbi:ribosomal protein S5 domain 2-type protein [Dichotomocladium elegans]|nr:ribosomal protein S5 domain 2-type protein [Dichotomocladium elegans]